MSRALAPLAELGDKDAARTLKETLFTKNFDPQDAAAAAVVEV